MLVLGQKPKAQIRSLFRLEQIYRVRLRPEAWIITGFIVLLEKEIIFVYVIFKAVQTGVISIVVVVFVHFVAK